MNPQGRAGRGVGFIPVVAQHQQVPVRWDGRVGREIPFGGLGGVIREGPAGQIHRGRVVVVEFHPVNKRCGLVVVALLALWSREGVGDQPFVNHAAGRFIATDKVLPRPAGTAIPNEPVQWRGNPIQAGVDPEFRRGDMLSDLLGQREGGGLLRVVRLDGKDVPAGNQPL